MRKMKLEISKGCDRNIEDVTKNQISFVNFCVQPLAKSMNVMIVELVWCLQNIQVNERKWKEDAARQSQIAKSIKI